jgi:Putative peptidoglycan binding domain
VIEQRVLHNIIHQPVACLGVLILSAGIAGATVKPVHRKTSSTRNAVSSPNPRLELASAKSRKAKAKAKKQRGQQVIEGDRAREIQTALVREGYMQGEPSGLWDQPTRDAMTRYQADHGWQTKTLPDSRALIQLGLGPRHENAINAQAVSPGLPAQAPVKNSAMPESHQ